MPMLPEAYRLAWSELQLDDSVVNTILASRALAEKLAEVLSLGGKTNAKRVANWFASVHDDTAEDSVTTGKRPC